MALCGPWRFHISTSAEVPGAGGQTQTTAQHSSHGRCQVAAPHAPRVRNVVLLASPKPKGETCTGPQVLREGTAEGECLPGARPARYLSINYPDFSPRFTL